ncbi:MAG TPA: SMC-Scp complex subunit ScpB [Gemmatimonadota bacterium]|nr:SMC-Scp complex subunit ScpB [Gemmatimonadota bacterium]
MSESTASPKQILEALLFAADEPLTARRIAGMLDEATPGSVADLVRDLNADYLREDRAFHVQEIAGGYRLVTRPEFATWIADLRASDSSPRLSQAALETLSIVAYKQPVTRAELESIRGVTVEGVLKTLVDRELVRIAGREEGMGRPLLYGTTEHFLEYFGLPSLEALPRPDELEILFADRERQEELAIDEGAAPPEPGADGGEE